MSDESVAAELRAIADKLHPAGATTVTAGVPALVDPTEAVGAGVIDPGYLPPTSDASNAPDASHRSVTFGKKTSTSTKKTETASTKS